MNIEILREYCLAKAGTEETFPFGPDTIVFKVGGKIFLLSSLNRHPLEFNVKCIPDHAIQLREEYPNHVFPGYHMNKKHWNTVICKGEINNWALLEMINESYELILKSLPKTMQKELEKK